MEGSAIGGAGGQVYRTDCIEKNYKTDVIFMIVLIISVTEIMLSVTFQFQDKFEDHETP